MNVELVHKSVYRVDTPFGGTGMVYLYLVKGDSIALIDTGAIDSPQGVLRPALAEIGLSLSDVDIILNTHAHLDHAGGNAEMKRVSGAPIYMHAADVAIAESTEVEIEFHTAPLRTLGYPQEAIQERADHVVRNAKERVGVDVPLSDGDTIDLGQGIRLQAIHSPGHTPGLVAYYWEDEGVLFTGDGVQGQGARPGGYPYYFDAPAYRRSVVRLDELGPEVICLGHAFPGGTAVNEPVRKGQAAKIFTQASLAVADTIHRAVADAVRRLPGASKRELAYAALDELIYEIPQLRIRTTGMPILGGPTLLAHVEAALAGTYPA